MVLLIPAVFILTAGLAGAVGLLISGSGSWPVLVAAGIGLAAGKQGAELALELFQAFGATRLEKEKSEIVLVGVLLGAVIAVLAYLHFVD